MRGVDNTANYLKDLQAGKHPETSEKYKDGVVDTLKWVLDKKAEYPIKTNEMIEKASAPKKAAKGPKKTKEPKAAKPRAAKPKAAKPKATTGFHPVPKPSQVA